MKVLLATAAAIVGLHFIPAAGATGPQPAPVSKTPPQIKVCHTTRAGKQSCRRIA